jgi:hypothetical protein
MLVYALCIWLAWRPASAVFDDRVFVVAAALAFPPAWQLAVYGQTTLIPLLAFTAAWEALEHDRRVLAGVALSLLTIKPQFAVVITAVTLLTLEWRMMLGAAAGIAVQFKEQRRLWYRALLERMGIGAADALATQLQILSEGALAAALVRGDPSLARSARAAAEVLIDNAVTRRRRTRSRARSA